MEGNDFKDIESLADFLNEKKHKKTLSEKFDDDLVLNYDSTSDSFVPLQDEEIQEYVVPDEPDRHIKSDTIEINKVRDITDSELDKISHDENSEYPYENNEIDEEAELSDEEKQGKKERIKKLKAKKRHKRTFTHIFGASLLTVFLISVSVVLAIFIIKTSLDFTGIGKAYYETQINITDDTTTEDLAEKLNKNGIIYMPEVFCMYAKMFNADAEYVNGSFTIDTTMSYSTIIRTLQTESNITETVQISIIEGMRAEEIGKLLEENFVCRAEDFEKTYKTLTQTYKFEKRLESEALKFYQMEGYLFPDTYDFYVIPALREDPDMDTSANAKEAADTIFSNFNVKITSSYYARMKKLDLSLDEVITLASIVQREANSVDNMEKVASVFFNRLESDYYPNLESDPTSFYVRDFIKPHISKENYSLYENVFMAYDSYECDGIPVGPICNPGIAAIEAVLYAPETEYYYFCSHPETTETYFASTIEEHEENLRICGLDDAIAE